MKFPIFSPLLSTFFTRLLSSRYLSIFYFKKGEGREENKWLGFLSLLLITQAAYARMQRGKEEEGPSSSSPRKGEGGRLLKAKRGKGKRELERRRRMSLHHSLFPSFAPPAAAAKTRRGMQGNRRVGFTKVFFLSLSLGITALIDGPSLVPSIYILPKLLYWRISLPSADCFLTQDGRGDRIGEKEGGGLPPSALKEGRGALEEEEEGPLALPRRLFTLLHVASSPPPRYTRYGR